MTTMQPPSGDTKRRPFHGREGGKLLNTTKTPANISIFPTTNTTTIAVWRNGQIERSTTIQHTISDERSEIERITFVRRFLSNELARVDGECWVGNTSIDVVALPHPHIKRLSLRTYAVCVCVADAYARQVVDVPGCPGNAYEVGLLAGFGDARECETAEEPHG